MIVTENEIETTVRKAAEKFGLDTKASTDFAKGVAWLAAVGLNGIPAAAHALARTAGNNTKDSSTPSPISVATDGPDLCRLALSLDHSSLKELGRVDEPLLLLGLAVIAASGGRSLGVEWEDAHEKVAAYCIDGTALIAAGSTEALDAEAAPTRIGRAPLSDLHAPFELRPDDILARSKTSHEEGISVADADWQVLQQLAGNADTSPAEVRHS